MRRTGTMIKEEGLNFLFCPGGGYFNLVAVFGKIINYYIIIINSRRGRLRKRVQLTGLS